MRKFNTVYKEKVNESAAIHETNIVNDFKKIFNALLEHYNLTAIHDLNEQSQLAFLTELNQYWTEENGLNETGKNFLQKRELRLTENSTPLQKKNFLKSKTSVLLSETLRQSDLKYKIYEVIDEMYNQVEGNDISDVLNPEMISNILAESFGELLDGFISNIHNELSESLKAKEQETKKLNESTTRIFLKKK